MAYETLGSSALPTVGETPPPQCALSRYNKVPEVTVYFWTIKVLCTTVGETAAASDVQPAVGILSEVGSEAEGLRQGEVGAVEAAHDVFGSPPLGDLPSRRG
ncbi:hypothetical protein [Streptomyces sp. NPDC004680]|uniref:hypothetical protein n=1 Tax=Streptomyces sp. NPDC004680 TaxID=3154287 RepID=UPI0033A1EC55